MHVAPWTRARPPHTLSAAHTAAFAVAIALATIPFSSAEAQIASSIAREAPPVASASPTAVPPLPHGDHERFSR